MGIVTEFTEELAQRVLSILNKKGWSLYPAVFSADDRDVAPAETIRNGPAQELLREQLYILLPQSQDPRDPEQVTKALKELTGKIRGKPMLPNGYQRIELLAFKLRAYDVLIPLERKKDPTSKEGPYQSIAMPYSNFIESLDLFFDAKKQTQINYAKIDQPIRHLIYTLDQVPFLKTIKSRAGRLREEIKEPALLAQGKTPFVNASENCMFITGGYLEFKLTDRSNPHAKEFIEEARKITEEYSFAALHEKGKVYRIDTSCGDLTRASEITEEDDIETKIRKQSEVKKSIADKRIQAFFEIRDKLEKLAERYINS